MNYQKKIDKKEDSLFVKSIDIFFAYWPVFILFGVIAIFSGFIFIRYATPKYQANASIIIKDQKKGNEESKLMESINTINQKKIIENEVEVLQSRPIMEYVVKKLHLYIPIYKEGRIKSLSAYKQSPIFIEMKNPDTINTTYKHINFKYDADNKLVYLNNNGIFSINRWVNTPYGLLKFTVNSDYAKVNNSIIYPSLQNEKKYYFNIVKIDDAVETITDNLKVAATNKLSSVVNLQYNDNRPKLAEDVLNEVIFSYNRIATLEKNILAKNTLGFIDERLAKVKYDLDLIESKVRQYKGDREAVDISKQGQLYLENVSANDKKLSELDMQLSVVNELEKHVISQDENIGILPASLGVVDPTLSQLVNVLNTSELEKEKLKKTVAENNPILVSLNDQITNTKQKINENISSYRKSLEATKENIYDNSRTYAKMLQDIPLKEQVLLEISRDNKIKSDIYAFLLQKREESELAYISNLSENQILNYAYASNDPVSPNKLIILGSILLSIVVVPFGVLSVRERLNKAILYRDDIEQLTSLPIIGEVAQNRFKDQSLVEMGENNSVLDEFRRLRYSLLSRGIGTKYRKLLISSSISGEGKSYIAMNLALSYAKAGKKVVLVDFDLHHSSLKEIFGVEDTVGVSDYLNKDAILDEIIQPVVERENLFFIAAGSAYLDPSRLLENNNLGSLIAALEEEYDLIIMDSPPVIQVADAYALSSYTDITLFVVKHGYSPKKHIKVLELNIDSMLLKDPAIIFNGVKSRGFSSNDYGYGYNLPYGNYKRVDQKRIGYKSMGV